MSPIRFGPTADGRQSGDVDVVTQGSGEHPRPAAGTTT
jgi:hypothetical protein